MSRFTSYYLYQKYEKVGDGEWTPTYPNEYSISGDTENAMPLVIKSENDENCGYRDPIYRWANTEDTICVFEDEHDYSQDYLTIESLEDNNVIYWKTSAITKTISASTDNGQTWVSYTSTSGGSGTALATLNARDKLFIKGKNSTYGAAYKYNQFKTTKSFKVYGNIMSLISGDSFANADELTASDTFNYLFYQCTGLTSAEKLILPATKLANYCYGGMFRGCTSLTTAPELPATTLKRSCYSAMFSGCTSLTTAPELPATTLADSCYSLMFNDCTSLVNAPELPATTLAFNCYDGMFAGCTSLTTAPELPATTLVGMCYYGMFSRCANLTTPPRLTALNLANSCYWSMFSHCTSLVNAPELPATTLAESCYTYMFYDCTSLTTAPELPATTLVKECYWAMFDSCTNLNYIKCLATDKSASYCTRVWVVNVASSGTFIKDANTTWSTGTSGIPEGWTVQNA